MRQLAVGETHRIMRAEDDRAVGLARQLQRMIGEQIMNVVGIDDIGLDPAQQLVKCADGLRIPQRKPSTEPLRVARVNVIGWDAVTCLFKRVFRRRGDDMRFNPRRRQSPRQPPEDRLRPASAFRRHPIIEEEELHFIISAWFFRRALSDSTPCLAYI